MKPWMTAAIGAALFTIGTSASAKDTDPCGEGMVCATSPDTVMKAFERLELPATLGEDSRGDPMVSSEYEGWKYQVYFYDCEESIHCASVQFSVSFSADESNTIELANKWNSEKRVAQMAILEDGTLAARYDVSTVGGLNEKNFDDVVTWWLSTMDTMSEFFDENL